MLLFFGVSSPFCKLQSGSSASLELDLERYVVPSPATSATSGLVYQANMAETPRYLSARKKISGTASDLPDGGDTCSRRTVAKVCYSYLNVQCNHQLLMSKHKSFISLAKTGKSKNRT